MPYNLTSMIDAKSSNKARHRRALRLRKATIQHEQALANIYLTIVKYWRERVSILEPVETPALVDAIPDASQIREEDASQVIDAAIVAFYAWLDTLAEWRRRLFIQRVKTEFDIDLSGLASSQVDSPIVREIALWASDLMQDVSDTVQKQLTTSITQNVAKRATQKEITEGVVEVLAKAERRARFIASDMTVKLTEKITEAQSLEAGSEKYKWNHSFRPRPRRHHVERQGNIYSWKKPPYDGHPGHLPNCRCSAEPLF